MENLSRETKAELIEKNECKISDLTKVALDKLKSTDAKQVDLCDLLFAHRRVRPSWKNVLESFKHNDIALSKSLNDYMFDKKTVDEIVESDFLTPDELINKNGNYGIAYGFYQSLLAAGKIPLECFSILMSVCPWSVDDFDLMRISQEEMNYLIELKILKFSDEKYNLKVQRVFQCILIQRPFCQAICN